MSVLIAITRLSKTYRSTAIHLQNIKLKPLPVLVVNTRQGQRYFFLGKNIFFMEIMDFIVHCVVDC